MMMMMMLQAKRENTQPCFPCDGSGARKSTLLFLLTTKYNGFSL